MWQEIIFAIWFMLPAGLANGAPVVSAHLPWLKRFDAPIDGGQTWRGKRLLGSHKTWRGLVSGMLVSTLVLWLQQVCVAHFGWAAAISDIVDYAHLPVLVLGPLMGFGTLAGDAIESFFKRQRGVEAGGSWPPFDQLDFIVGATLVTLPFVILPASQYVLIAIIWFYLHLLGSFVGWKLGLKERPI